MISVPASIPEGARRSRALFPLVFMLLMVLPNAGVEAADSLDEDPTNAWTISSTTEISIDIPDQQISLPSDADPGDSIVAVMPGLARLVPEEVSVPSGIGLGDTIQIPTSLQSPPRVTVARALSPVVRLPGLIRVPELQVMLPSNFEPGMPISRGPLNLPLPAEHMAFEEGGVQTIAPQTYAADLQAGSGGLAPLSCNADGICPIEGLVNFVEPLLAAQASAESASEADNSGIVLVTPEIVVEVPDSSPEVNLGGGTVRLPPEVIPVPPTAIAGDTIVVPASNILLPPEAYPAAGEIIATEPLSVGASLTERTILLGSADVGGESLFVPEQILPLPGAIGDVTWSGGSAYITVASASVSLPEMQTDSSPPPAVPDDPPMYQEVPWVHPVPVTPTDNPLSGSPIRECDDGITADEIQLCVVIPPDASTTALTGRVTMDDDNLEPIQEATVILLMGQTELTATTDALGQFAFANISVGSSGDTSGSLHVIPPPGSLKSPTVLGEWFMDGYVLEGGEGYGVQVLLDELPFEDTAPPSTGGSSRAALGHAAAGAPYSSHRRPPPLLEVDMYRTNSTCASTGVLRKADKRFPWKFYVLHVLKPEIGGEIPKMSGGRAKRGEYLRSNAMAVSNYAWYHRTKGNNINNTTSYQCFKPGMAIPSWWGEKIKLALTHRVLRSGDIQKTEYKGYGSGTHQESCNPPFIYQGTYQLSQIESRHCADDGKTWNWIIDNYYINWNLHSAEVPGEPSVSFPEKGASSITVNWDSPSGWHIQVWRNYYDAGSASWVGSPAGEARYNVAWNRVTNWQGTVVKKGGRRIPHRVADAVSCKTYRYIVRAHNPSGWGNWTVKQVRPPC